MVYKNMVCEQVLEVLIITAVDINGLYKNMVCEKVLEVQLITSHSNPFFILK